MRDTTLACLSELTYRADAKQGVCLVPLGSIYWDDEMPQLHRIPAEDHDQVFLLFAIRSKVWDEVPLSADEKLLWDLALCKAPQWALFNRLALSPEEQEARENAERYCAQALDELFASADHITISKKAGGFQKVSATFRLDKQNKHRRRRSWWKVMARRVKYWIKSRNL